MVSSLRSSVEFLPVFEFADAVDIFYLESPFPYTVPANISKAAGVSFNDFVLTHAGIGILNRVTGMKFSVQFVPDGIENFYKFLMIK